MINKGVAEATKVATKGVENEIQEESRREIQRLIEDGYFKVIVNEIVQEFMYLSGFSTYETNQATCQNGRAAQHALRT